MEEQSYELRATDYELENNLANLENLNKILVQITYNLIKIKVQTSMANGHFGIITFLTRDSYLKSPRTSGLN